VWCGSQYAIKMAYDVDGEYYSKFYDMSLETDSETENEDASDDRDGHHFTTLRRAIRRRIVSTASAATDTNDPQLESGLRT